MWRYKNSVFFLVFLVSSLSFGQSEKQIQRIKEQYRSSGIHALALEFEKEDALRKADLGSLARSKGWRVSEKLPNGSYSQLQEVGPDGTPIYYTTFNDDVSRATRADALYDTGILNLGINGEGMLVGVWDAGLALADHQEFDTRVNVADDSNEIHLHATRVMGTLIASGVKENVKGVAYGASALTSNWSRDKIEVAQAAANGLLLSNHSYGINSTNVPDWYFGSYIKVSQDWDKIMFNAPYYLMVTAAGNSQRLGHNSTPIFADKTKGFDLMLGFATSKNGITVAAADTKIDDRGNLVNANITDYSSFGPVDDGRIKPDIAGNGSNIYTTNSTDRKSYGTYSGTSMAAPGVTGSMLLLQQYYERLNKMFMKASTLKGLILHSADDVDLPGPDYKMGWGVINTKRAAEIMVNKDYRTLISEDTLEEGETYSFTVKSNGDQPLMASISWTDPAGEHINSRVLNDATPALVNDLDMRISKDGQTYYPWKLSAINATNGAVQGDNRVDPFEKVEIPNASAGTYTITVSYKGNLKNGLQDFSIIVSGIAVTQCNAVVPFETVMTRAGDDTIALEWEPIEDALFEVQYKSENALEWEILYTEDNFILLEGLVLETDYNLRLQTICTENMASEYTPEMTFVFLGKETDLDGLLDYETLNISDDIVFSLYPNPAVDRITLEGNSLSNKAKYRIMSTTGVIIREGNAKESEINVANLSSGLYIMSVQDINGIKSTKFYKN